jgi:hypothetical protein
MVVVLVAVTQTQLSGVTAVQVVVRLILPILVVRRHLIKEMMGAMVSMVLAVAVAVLELLGLTPPQPKMVGTVATVPLRRLLERQ